MSSYQNFSPEADLDRISDEYSQCFHQTSSVQNKLLYILNLHSFHIGVIALVLFDAAIVITLIILEQEHSHTIAFEVLHYTSLAILALFMIELLLKIFAHRLEFFKSKLEVFDGFVIVISFTVDVILSIKHISAEYVALLIVLRLWRIVRIISATVVSVKTEMQDKLDSEKKRTKILEDNIAMLQDYIVQLKESLLTNNVNIPSSPKLQSVS